MTRRSAAWLFACLSLSIASGARGDDVDALFNSLFAERVRQAAGTPDSKDDIALAGEMLAAAKQFPQQQKLVTRLCTEAWELTNRREPGWDAAAAAMNTLLELAPQQRVLATERLAELRQRQYGAAKPALKNAAGLELIAALDAAAAAKEEAGDPAGALTHLRPVLGLARSLAKEKLDVLQRRHDRCANLARGVERAAKLETELKAAPDAGKAEELVRLYIMDLDRPAAALAHLPLIKDESFRTNAALAATPLADVALPSCLPLAIWYRGLANAAPAAAKPPLLARAYASVDRFLVMHDRKDLQRTQAELLAAELNKAIDGLGPMAIRPPAWVKPPDPAVAAAAAAAAAAEAEARKLPENLLDLLDLDQDAVLGVWKKTDAGGVTSPDAQHMPARLQVPVLLDGDFKLTLKLRREKGDEAIVIALPLPDGRQVALVIDGWVQQHGGVSYLEWVDRFIGPENPTAVKQKKISDKESHTLEITVKNTGADTAIDVDLDGASLTRWTGPRRQMWVTHHWRGYAMNQPVLGTWSNSVTFESMKVQMLKGEAKKAPRPTLDKLPDDAVFLGDLKETVVEALHWNNGREFGKKGDYRGALRCVKIGGVRSINGIYAHPAWPSKKSHVSWDLGGKYRTFVAAAGVSEIGEPAASDLTFIVHGDGKELWRSKPTRKPGVVQPVQLDISGVQKLDLIVEAADSVANARAAWIEPAVFERMIAAPLIEGASDTKADPPQTPAKQPDTAQVTPAKPSGRGFFGLPID